ncbi:MAG: sensor histidine kinase [Luteibaculaceae bacterium]
MENFLPSNTVYDLAFHPEQKDMYLGTKLGLYQYNGFTFNKIPGINQNSFSVTALNFDNNNRLWAINFANQVFYLEKDTLRVFNLEPHLEKLKLIKDIYIEGDKVFILATNGYLQVNSGQLNVVDYAYFESEFLLFKDSENTLLLTAQNQIELRGKEARILAKEVANPHVVKFKGNYLISFGSEQINFFLTAEPNATKPTLWNQENKSVKVNFIRFIQNQPWICTQEGLFRPSKNGYKCLFPEYEITDVVEDYQGNVWISTSNNGLLCVPSFNIEFIEQSLGLSVLDFMVCENKVYFITKEGGLGFYELETNILRWIKTNKKAQKLIHVDQRYQLLYLDNSVVDLATYAVLEDNIFIKGFIPTSDTEAIMAAYLDVFFVSRAFKTPSNTSSFKVRKIFDKTRIRNLSYFAPIKTVFLSTVEGLFKVDSSGAFSEVLYEDSKINALKSYELGTTQLIITLNGEFLGYNSQTLSVESLNLFLKAELPEKEFLDVKDNGTHFLVRTKNYFYLVSKHDLVAEILPLRRILGNIEISNFDFLNPETLLISTPLGLLPIAIEQLRSTGKSKPFFYIKQPKVNQLASLEYKYRDNMLFSVNPVFFHNRGATLQYSLLKNGEEVGVQQLNLFQPDIKYNSLGFGSYELQLKFSEDLGESFQESIFFQVKKPFWLEYYFIALFALLLTLAVYWVFKAQQVKYAQKQAQKDLLVNAQLVAMRSQMNPHFLYNVLNSMQGLIYSEKIVEAGEYINKFSTYMRNTLILSDRKEISIKEEVTFLTHYLDLEKLRFGDDFEYSIYLDPTLDDTFLIPAVLVQPFAENAVKHGLLNKLGAKVLSVEFLQQNGFVEIRVKDNGIGRKNADEINRKKADKFPSFATNAIVNRVHLMNKDRNHKIAIHIQDLNDKNDQPNGTLVQITIQNSAHA